MNPKKSIENNRYQEEEPVNFSYNDRQTRRKKKSSPYSIKSLT